MANELTAARGVPWFRETEVFTSGAEGYHTFRIPALAVAPDGTILAFCEGRRHGQDDYRANYLVLKRSADNGNTWGDLQLLVGDPDRTMNNPTVVVDRDTDTVWLTFCRHAYEVFVMKSNDSGASWSEPKNITSDVKPPGWTQYDLGPGHGIQLRSGRLVIPGDHIEGTRRDWVYSHSHVMYSDDHGEHWKAGGSIGKGTNESQVVETRADELYFNVRTSNRTVPSRVAAWSSDGGLTWSEPAPVNELPDPVCQGSIVRYTDVESHDKSRVIFANIANTTARDTFTLRVSYDECRTWPVSKVLNPGPSAYSDLAIASDMTICCLYERGVSHPYGSIRLAQFNLEWLTDGADSIAVDRGTT